MHSTIASMIEILRFRISYNFTSCPVNKGYQNPLIYEHNMFLLSKNFFLCMCGLCCNHVWEYHRDTQRTHASTTCSFCSSVTVRFSNGKVISATLRFYFSKKKQVLYHYIKITTVNFLCILMFKDKHIKTFNLFYVWSINFFKCTEQNLSTTAP